MLRARNTRGVELEEKKKRFLLLIFCFFLHVYVKTESSSDAFNLFQTRVPSTLRGVWEHRLINEINFGFRQVYVGATLLSASCSVHLSSPGPLLRCRSRPMIAFGRFDSLDTGSLTNLGLYRGLSLPELHRHATLVLVGTVSSGSSVPSNL